MRRLLPSARTFLIHSGQAAVQITGLAGLAVMAMAAAPRDVAPQAEAGAVPATAPVQAVAEAAGPVMRQLVFEAPVKGYAVNSAFGLRKLAIESRARAHAGVDIAAPMGTGVFATAEGVVLRTGHDPAGYGRFIEMRHPNGMTSLYGHLSRIDVHTGQTVVPGARIGLVGSTGYSTGPHLHFEVRRNGRPLNPAKVVGRTFQAPVQIPTRLPS
ncbi:MAG TPA: M23 family metallopeptidase [Brevundimonas sp.]|uniref:M23 family metallopeptidase n=1 Tax=Brevundimonas sp. TaxID=1871086 RepID=UPI002615114D|nr:M23 family metallopeptidase [Brevundimonas sp.]HRO34157.1 M23 family metallopeptidase [Brevundimonas sp.]